MNEQELQRCLEALRAGMASVNKAAEAIMKFRCAVATATEAIANLIAALPEESRTHATD